MRRNIVKAVVSALAAAVAMGIGTGVASAAVSPASASGCTFGSSSGNTHTCFSISGKGLHVNSMTSTATIENAGRTLSECITGPASVLPLCSSFVFVPIGEALRLTWSPDANEPAGTYCGETFRRNSDLSSTKIGSVCLRVSP